MLRAWECARSCCLGSFGDRRAVLALPAATCGFLDTCGESMLLVIDLEEVWSMGALMCWRCLLG